MQTHEPARRELAGNMKMRLIRRAGLAGMPWKNGGGITHEVAAWPEGAGLDDFLWRISIAEVAGDGPFSTFDGVDRTLTLLEGAGIALEFSGGGGATLARGSAPFSFPGEAAVTGVLLSGPIHDLNVMSRRGKVLHHVDLPAAGETPGPDTRAMICRAGPVTCGGHDMETGDVLLLDEGEAPPITPPVAGVRFPMLAVRFQVL